MKGNKKTFTKKKTPSIRKTKSVAKPSSPQKQTPPLSQPPAAPVSNTPASSAPAAPPTPQPTAPPALVPTPPPPPPVAQPADSAPQSSLPELSPDSSEDDISPNDRKNNNFFILGCFALLVLIILTAIIPWFLSQDSSQQADALPTPTPMETKVPIQKSLNKSDWTFEVLNGSGTAGAAGKIAEKIKALGFDVIKVGNADKSDYTTTQVFIKSSLTDQKDQLLEELKDAIPSASYSGELQDSTASARVIVGKE